MKRKTAAFITLGCKINQYETEAIREEVLNLGYEEVSPHEAADVYVVNTCAVTRTAGVKSRKYTLRAARTNPDARIIVVGCSTPSEREKYAEIPQVVFLAGNEEKARVASFIAGSWKPGEVSRDRGGDRASEPDASEPDASELDRDILSLSVSRYSKRTRATVKVQDGCNNFCSFCIIPHLRGLSRSRPPEGVIEEIRRLTAAGSIEVVLSGIHLQDYGLDLDPPMTLVELLRRVSSIDGLRRIRLSSLGPGAFGPELLDLLEDPVFCRHWHVPIQAGCDGVLARMRRGYTLEEYSSKIERLRERFDEPAITTDVIVGHPGETAELFERSLEVYQELRFSKIHVFPFSLREGTLASKMKEGRVTPDEIRERARRLGEVDREMAAAYRSRFLGEEIEVLVEAESKESPGFLEGLSDRYVRMSFPSPSESARRRFPGTLRRVRATGLGSRGLVGEWAERPVEELMDART